MNQNKKQVQKTNYSVNNIHTEFPQENLHFNKLKEKISQIRVLI